VRGEGKIKKKKKKRKKKECCPPGNKIRLLPHEFRQPLLDLYIKIHATDFKGHLKCENLM